MQTWIEYYCALQSYSSLHCGALSLAEDATVDNLQGMAWVCRVDHN